MALNLKDRHIDRNIILASYIEAASKSSSDEVVDADHLNKLFDWLEIECNKKNAQWSAPEMLAIALSYGGIFHEEPTEGMDLQVESRRIATAMSNLNSDLRRSNTGLIFRVDVTKEIGQGLPEYKLHYIK